MVEPTFDVNHVAEVVLNISNFPLETNVQFITIMATKMPYIEEVKVENSAYMLYA